jgi:hypothetical protein
LPNNSRDYLCCVYGQIERLAYFLIIISCTGGHSSQQPQEFVVSLHLIYCSWDV